MSEMPIREAQDNLGEVVSRSSSTGEVVYLTDHGERVAAIMPARRAAILDGLLAVEEYEASTGRYPRTRPTRHTKSWPALASSRADGRHLRHRRATDRQGQSRRYMGPAS
jgi:prevent-host-death family protein